MIPDDFRHPYCWPDEPLIAWRPLVISERTVIDAIVAAAGGYCDWWPTEGR